MEDGTQSEELHFASDEGKADTGGELAAAWPFIHRDLADRPWLLAILRGERTGGRLLACIAEGNYARNCRNRPCRGHQLVRLRRSIWRRPLGGGALQGAGRCRKRQRGSCNRHQVAAVSAYCFEHHPDN